MAPPMPPPMMMNDVHLTVWLHGSFENVDDHMGRRAARDWRVMLLALRAFSATNLGILTVQGQD